VCPIGDIPNSNLSILVQTLASGTKFKPKHERREGIDLNSLTQTSCSVVGRAVCRRSARKLQFHLATIRIHLDSRKRSNCLGEKPAVKRLATTFRRLDFPFSRWVAHNLGVFMLVECYNSDELVLTVWNRTSAATRRYQSAMFVLRQSHLNSKH